MESKTRASLEALDLAQTQLDQITTAITNSNPPGSDNIDRSDPPAAPPRTRKLKLRNPKCVIPPIYIETGPGQHQVPSSSSGSSSGDDGGNEDDADDEKNKKTEINERSDTPVLETASTPSTEAATASSTSDLPTSIALPYPPPDWKTVRLSVAQSSVRATYVQREFVSYQPDEFEPYALAPTMMSYPVNYMDSNRPAPMSPAGPGMANGGGGGGGGVNGAVGLGYGAAPMPIPAGHQADLNHIFAMVERLSEQLEHNRAITAGVVEKMGRVREKAAEGNLTNEELLSITADDINVDTRNIAKENSDLRGALEKAIHDRDENWKLALLSANIVSTTVEQVHEFREREDARILAWHRSYRQQLAEERQRNLDLMNEMHDMRAHAYKASEYQRKAYRLLVDDVEAHELRARNRELEELNRTWKRMAMRMIPPDSELWSDHEEYRDLPDEAKQRPRRERAAMIRRYGPKDWVEEEPFDEGEGEGEGEE